MFSLLWRRRHRKFGAPFYVVRCLDIGFGGVGIGDGLAWVAVLDLGVHRPGSWGVLGRCAIAPGATGLHMPKARGLESVQPFSLCSRDLLLIGDCADGWAWRNSDPLGSELVFDRGPRWYAPGGCAARVELTRELEVFGVRRERLMGLVAWFLLTS